MKEDPPLDARCRDKFLVQSVLVTADKEFTNVASLVRFILQYQEILCGRQLTRAHVVVAYRTDRQTIYSGEED